jgi:D-arabinose 1-dehydrogenase-like Zn-dependent alcohol dehydrogenase
VIFPLTKRQIMKAAVLVGPNRPWQIKKLKDPKPAAGQVVIKIHAAGMCGTDVHVHRGVFPSSVPLKFPLVAGHEPVGEVVELGEGVTTLKKGDRVGVSWAQKGCGRCPYCQRKEIKYCNGRKGGAESWIDLGGGFSEYMLAWEEGCTLLPKNLSYVQAAPLFCGGFTIASGFYNAKPKPGERICVLGLGGLGHLAVQFAKAKGHEVVVVTSHKDKVPLAKKLGADIVIPSYTNVGESLKKIGGVDVLMQTSSSSELANNSLAGLRPEGRMVVMGIDDHAIETNPAPLIHKQIKIIGSIQNHRSDLIDILELAAAGKLHVMVETYPLEQINQALDRLMKNQVRFRAVITF